MSPIHDWFVGLVAIVVGCLLMLGAMINLAPLMALSKVRLLTQWVGQGRARAIVAAVGAACIAMGALIASGWRMHW